jgi:hypothetical protein
MANVEGKIAAILSRTEVVINRGSQDGVEVGDSFYIYSQLGPFFDPDTRESLGVTIDIWGDVNVVKVEKRFCIAETGYQVIGSFFPPGLESLFGVRKEQIKLPVNESQITRVTEKIEVGFLARLVKKQKALTEKSVNALPPVDIEAIESSATKQDKDSQDKDSKGKRKVAGGKPPKQEE